jgi:uncharacterized RDD family membrane protein YckC
VAAADSAHPEQAYPGQRLGLPPEGHGAVAGWGRRIAALFLDWFAASLVAVALRPLVDGGRLWEQAGPLLVFWAEATVLTALVGGSFGQLLLRVAVVRLDGRPPSLAATAVRTLLICLAVPPLVFNRDNRGLHDLAVGTVAVRR